MANAFSDILEMTQIGPSDDLLVDSPSTPQPLAMRSVSKLFKPSMNKELHVSQKNYNDLEEAMLHHDMDLIKHHLLCKCPLQRMWLSYIRDSQVMHTYISFVAVYQSVGSLKSYARKSPIDIDRLESIRCVDLLCLTATYGRTDIVHILLKRLAQDDIEPEELFDLNSSLHQACKLNNKVMVEMLLKAGATPWEKDENGFSAMHHAAFSGSLEASLCSDKFLV